MASIICGIVVPRLAFRSAITAAAFEPGRDVSVADADLGRATALGLIFGVRVMGVSILGAGPYAGARTTQSPANCKASLYFDDRSHLPANSHSNASRANEVQSIRTLNIAISLEKTCAMALPAAVASRRLLVSRAPGEETGDGEELGARLRPSRSVVIDRADSFYGGKLG